MNIPKIKILKKTSKNQLKIIYISAIGVFIFTFFIVLIYAPQGRKLVHLKDELSRTKSEIAEIIGAAGMSQDMPGAFRDLSARLNDLSARLTDRNENIISSLSQEAKKLEIEIKNISPAQKLSVNSGVIGWRIEELRVAMSLSCDFRALGDYLDILRNKFPYLIKINQLDIKGSGEGKAHLDVELALSAYLGKKG